MMSVTVVVVFGRGGETHPGVARGTFICLNAIITFVETLVTSGDTLVVCEEPAVQLVSSCHNEPQTTKHPTRTQGAATHVC